MQTGMTHLENIFLFELEQAQSLGIPNEVVEFLKNSRFPWQALGKPLTEFVKKVVAAVPVTERIRGHVSPHAVLDGDDIVIAEGAVVEPHAFIAGPTFIGPGAVVRQGAYVRGSVYVCSQAVVGHTSEVKGALLLPKAKAAHFAYVGDAIMGYDTNLGAGTKFANLRFDHGQIVLRLGTERVETGLKKFGAILGNRAQTGCNSVTNPGTILLPGAMIRPNFTASGIVERIAR